MLCFKYREPLWAVEIVPKSDNRTHVAYTGIVSKLCYTAKSKFTSSGEKEMPNSWPRPPLQTVSVRYPQQLAEVLKDHAAEDGVTLTRLLVELAAAEMERRGRIKIEGPANYSVVAGPFPNS